MAVIKNEYLDILVRSLGLCFFMLLALRSLVKKIIPVKHRRHCSHFTHQQCGAKRDSGKQYYFSC